MYKSGKYSSEHRRELILDEDNKLRYDFSHWDVLKCLGSYEPIFMSSAYCNTVRIKWYWPAELFAFRNIWSVRLSIFHHDKQKVITSMSPEIQVQLVDLNETHLAMDTTYRTCINVKYLLGYLSSHISNRTEWEQCQLVHTYCNEGKASKPFLTIEWTITIISILTLIIVVLAIAICFCKKKIKTGESDEDPLIYPSDTPDQDEIMRHQPVNQYNVIPYDTVAPATSQSDVDELQMAEMDEY